MLGSENHFFNQDKATLNLKRDYVWKLLTMKGYCNNAVAVYLKAYDYFCVNPTAFDGATLVRDICDIDDLDLDAMLHDWMYIFYNVGSSLVYKAKADYLYKCGMMRKKEKLNKYWVKFFGMPYIAYSRFIGLSLSGIGFVPYSLLKHGKMTNEQKELFMIDYKILTFVN